MALTTTTLAAACGVNDTTISVTSATGFVPQQLLRIDDEILAQSAAGSSGTRISVRRGLEGTIPAAHAVLASVATGTGAEFAAPPAGEVVMPPSGASVVRQATVTLTDAQIKALPTTAVVVIPASGPNRINVLVLAHCRLVGTTSYTNLNTTNGGLYLVTDPASNYDIITPKVRNTFFDNTTAIAMLPPLTIINASEVCVPVFGWESPNTPMAVAASNPTNGNFTGGHPSNMLTVTVLYTVYDVEAKAFV